MVTPAVSDVGEDSTAPAAAAVPHTPFPTDKMELLWSGSVPVLPQLQQGILDTGAEFSLPRDARHALTFVSAIRKALGLPLPPMTLVPQRYRAGGAPLEVLLESISCSLLDMPC